MSKKKNASNERNKVSSKKLCIAALGASAGGLEALQQFFAATPQGHDIAYVVITHLNPDRVSMLPDLLQKHTDLTVAEAVDGTTLAADHVYVGPPDTEVGIIHGVLQLMQMPKEGVRAPIDYFFRSLAKDQGPNAAGIVLSGMGTDGTAGLKEIKAELGLAMVQDPETAAYQGMPRSAVASGIVDFVLAPDKLPEKLLEYAAHAFKMFRAAPSKLVDHTDLQKIFMLLQNSTGHDFSTYKAGTVQRRLQRRMSLHQLDNIDDYVRYLRQNQEEVQSLFKELLIGVTGFFRDAEAFEALREKALPKIFEKPVAAKEVRIWVPGCSTGEEAYTVAITVQEYLEKHRLVSEVQVFATDIDDDSIQHARAGIYPKSIEQDLSDERLERFFEEFDGRYRIKRDVREMLVFAPQSVIKDPPFSRLSMISCRNLLIYLNAETQKRLLPLFHYSLKPGGILFLGSAETVGGFADLFAPIDTKWKIYLRREDSGAEYTVVDFPLSRTRSAERVQETPVAENSLPQNVEKFLIRRFTPCSVLVNGKGQVHYIHGRSGKFLEHATGKFSADITDIARDGLRLALQAALRKAVKQGQEFEQKGLRIKDDGGHILVNLRVIPIREPEALRNLFMVVFEEMPTEEKRSAGKHSSLPPGEEGDRVQELEEELRHTKESLQSNIEEMETTNEELKATNEEYQSTNEELQSANEELETSKEEMQSLNEELQTVNSELRDKIQEVSQAYQEMRQFLDSLEIPTIFLDNNFNIRKFSANAKEVIKVIESDVGRPVSDIADRLKGVDITKEAGKVLRNLQTVEREVQTRDGKLYVMRIIPYRTTAGSTDGAILIFFDIQEMKAALTRFGKLKKDHNFLEDIVNTLREPLLVLDDKLQVVAASRPFYKMFDTPPEETLGRTLDKLGNGQWDIPALTKRLKRVLPGDEAFDDFEVDHEFPGIGRRRMMLNARRLDLRDEKSPRILLAIEDITQRKR